MTRRALVYDCFSGISGDMHIGAMLDIGVPADHLRAELGKLAMADEFELRVETAAKMGISGTRATVVLSRQPHHHRYLADIEKIIHEAGYAEPVCSRALDIFRHIAVAEAQVHGTTVDKVHFHEVGATDSIVDIVAAALCLEYLEVDQVFCCGLELGGGMVRCAHGLMPVPAPATAEILKGVPCRYNGVNQEATTPTGAAILKHAVHAYSMPRAFSSETLGYGIGQKDFDIPNVLRVMVGSVERSGNIGELASEQNLEINCNIDDMSPEAFQPVLALLFESGARDVFLTPIIMKKSRPGTRLTVLAAPERVPELLHILFHNSTTIGVRIHEVTKQMLPRVQRPVSTSLGAIDVKVVTLPDGSHRWKLEHDECVALAARLGRSYLEVRTQLEREVATTLVDTEGGTDA